ncbi:MAG: sigma-54-dependent Fis family transcriptional regulator [Thermovenabulum sp.]|uniref:sigma-54-dependent Fis family transcriptional regulator n=1 Tax=Thermovenabulum sp. TaxID=3100335 RepID=UPI003C7C8A02
MSGILKNIEEDVKKYAAVLSKILKVDIEIVDEKLNRIAGTGMFASKINVNMGQEGYVYKKVLRTGEKQIVENPGFHELCKRCPKQNKCEETFEMSTPIKIGENVIGVIGFVCFNEEQKEHILNNFDTFMDFLEQISDLISSKAKEEIEKENMKEVIEMLNHIIDKIDQGVLIIDERDIIVQANSVAKKMIGIQKVDGKRVTIKQAKGTFLNMEEYELSIDDKHYSVIGEEYRILKNGYKYDKILIFTEINSLKQKLFSVANSKENLGLEYIIGESESIKMLKEKVKRIASSSSTVLITGESGTGKELFARAIHLESERKDNPFVAVNCAAIPDTLLESELFGYVKGAFTGADPKGKIGKIEFANKGTLFLDEIGDMPLYLQAKLLRVLEQKEVVRLGSNKPIPVDVRIIAATNKNLEKMIKEGMFREDLYYRLNVIPFVIPPLRERKEDIKVLTEYFVNKYADLLKKKVFGVEKDVWDYFFEYDWPGNVRELENVVEYMINMLDSEGVLNSKLLPLKVRHSKNRSDNAIVPLEELEREMIRRALDIFGNNVEGKRKAAEALGIGIATLYRKIKNYNME